MVAFTPVLNSEIATHNPLAEEATESKGGHFAKLK